MSAEGSDQDENAPPRDADAELEAAIAAIRGNEDLPRPPYPTLPNMNGAPRTLIARDSALDFFIPLSNPWIMDCPADCDLLSFYFVPFVSAAAVGFCRSSKGFLRGNEQHC